MRTHVHTHACTHTEHTHKHIHTLTLIHSYIYICVCVYTVLNTNTYIDIIIIFLDSCKCGSILKCIIEDSDASSNCIKLNCTYTYKKGNCGKRFLRNPTRTTVGKELQNKSVHVYRAEKAHMLIREGDPEPPQLPSSDVLRRLKQKLQKLIT